MELDSKVYITVFYRYAIFLFLAVNMSC